MNLQEELLKPVCTEKSLYDNINDTVDIEKLQEVDKVMLEFAGNNEIVLYTSLNNTNTELLKKGKYNNTIMAFEYIDMAQGLSQAESIIKFKYNTKEMVDFLYPGVYNYISKIIKELHWKKSEITDKQVVKYITNNTKATGCRICTLNQKQKLYNNTNMMFENTKITYLIKPSSIEILDIIPK